MAKAWTVDDDAYLIELEGFEARLMAFDLGRTTAAIYRRKTFLRSVKGNERLAEALLQLRDRGVCQ
jgi:hypothetical protein